MTLLALQRDMAAWIRDSDPDAADRIGPGRRPGLNIYQNNYRAQLVACLEAIFPRTREWLGDDAFHDAMVRHIDRVPPYSWTLDAYGRDFPESLTLAYPDDREVSELAWLERALDDAFVAPDHAALDAASLAQVDWDSAILVLSPTIEIGPLGSNAPAIWSALAAGDHPPPAQMLDAPASLLVWRQDGTSCFRTVDALESEALRLARAGTSYGAICHHVVERLGEGEGVLMAGRLLGQWVSEGLIVSVR